MKTPDLVIIGAGPIGLACGIAAQKAGLNYIIIEKGTLVNSLFHYPQFMTFFSTSERLEIGGFPFNCINPKPGKQDAIEYYRRITQQLKLNVHLYETIEAVKKQADGTFNMDTSKGTYRSKYVIVATGFYDIPNKMNVPGEELPKVHHYYKDPHAYSFQKVLVIGAQNSAVDAALETWRKGASVTMAVRQNEIGKRVKYWVRPDIENRIAEGNIKAYFNTTVAAIREKEVDLMTPNGKVTIENDFVLAMTGFLPNMNLLRKMNIRLSEDGNSCPQYDPDTMETNVPGLFLAGVICGGRETHKWFIENSRVHAEQIMKAIAAKA